MKALFSAKGKKNYTGVKGTTRCYASSSRVNQVVNISDIQNYKCPSNRAEIRISDNIVIRRLVLI